MEKYQIYLSVMMTPASVTTSPFVTPAPKGVSCTFQKAVCPPLEGAGGGS